MHASNDNPTLGLTRRRFLTRCSMALACRAALPFRHAAAQPAEAEFIEVNTAYRRIRGMKSDGLATFKGIPYGGSVSAVHRFKAAPPLRPLTGVRDALQMGPQCKVIEDLYRLERLVWERIGS